MRLKLHAISLALGTLSVLAACGGSDRSSTGGNTASGGAIGSNTDCSPDALKTFVLDTAYEWYLFPELLPARSSVNPAQFATPLELLDFLTSNARNQRRDRFFSSTVSIAEENALLNSGATAAFGFTSATNSGRVFILQVIENTPASRAGFARGDEILAIGPNPASLETVSAILARDGTINNALGPSTVGTTRSFRVRTQAGATAERTITREQITLVPVPTTGGVSLLPRSGNTPVGYVQLRTFIDTAEPQLRAAFLQLRNAGVRDLIVDLRYNGGGLVRTAELLLNLFARELTGVSFRDELNPSKSANNRTTNFAAQPESIAPLRIAFLATRNTASASELVINSMASVAQTAVIGSRSFGKPVGQFAFDRSACDFRLRLVSFKTVNRDGAGDYFDGFPYAAFRGAACAANDDLTRAQGDANEQMTAEALFWINNNRCSGSAIADAPLDGASLLAGPGVSLKPQPSTPVDPPHSVLDLYLPDTY